MTPEFSPGPLGLPMAPIAMAAVGPLMSKTAARVADSVRLHGFATRRYLAEGAADAGDRTGGDRKNIRVFRNYRRRLRRYRSGRGGGGDAAEKICYRVAFYGLTPAYRGVFDIHGLSDLGVKLTEMSKQGAWKDMAAQVSDEVLDLFVARAPYEGIAEAIAQRFGGIVDTVSIDFARGTSAATRRDVIAAIQRIPSAFRGFTT